MQTTYLTSKNFREFFLPLCLGVVYLSFFSSSLVFSASPVQSSFVIEAATGKVLHQKNADVKTHPASLTKIMTILLAFEALDRGKITLHEDMIVSDHATRQIPSKLGLSRRNTLTVKGAILALITKSANDAAVVLAEHLAGSEEEFAKIMNKKAKALGMYHTHFRNSSGAPNKNQITTARDMATLARAVYRHYPHHYKYFNTKSFTFKGATHANHNRLLGKLKGSDDITVDGLKTGFICASGFNLTASAVQNNRRIIAVVMGGSSGRSRDMQMAKLIKATFQNTPYPFSSSNDEDETLDALPRLQTAHLDVSEDNEPLQELISHELEEGDRNLLAPIQPARAKIKPPASQPRLASHSPTERTISSKRPVSPRSWLIQVGVYGNSQQARLAALKAQKTDYTLQKAAIAIVKSTKKKGSSQHQARLTGLSKDVALKACKQLERKGMGCLALEHKNTNTLKRRRSV